ncbi:sulfite reductase subunit alpha [Undibacterium fentianense]|uniref:NADPH--hemoprotein reductase n=1 Tax=Undibacterium fentianense TaxID=2828728 RepID=A0A941IEQ3_9BURK|nr:sulfite reductase subunit alpha [Undibacterium fentianense]MBR7799876.1 flavodoxin domain-containing protein [Undibacterium fentianense]
MNSSTTPILPLRFLSIALVVAIGISAALLCFSLPISVSSQTARLFQASSLILSYGIFFIWIIYRHRLRHSADAPVLLDKENSHEQAIWIVYASQTGYAEQLAVQTEASLLQAKLQTRRIDIRHLNATGLQQAKRILFIVSTTGEGDAPDSAAQFTRAIMANTYQLHELSYAVLALGDRNYQAFCAFGQQLDHWLHQQGAKPLFDLVEVDNGDDGALRHWQHQLGIMSGQTQFADWHPAEYADWILEERECINPDSLGNPVFHLKLRARLGTANWEAGDIAEILPQRPGIETTLPHREYSIASIPETGSLDLVVRQMHLADGSLGLGSGWLTAYADMGATIKLRLRSNRSFHPVPTNRPCIFIGNGTGIAGLRAHLQHRERQNAPQNWLLFGERQQAIDFFFKAEIINWQKTGLLNQLDLAFSRDQSERIYVQDLLQKHAKTLQDWVKNGAAIYVCGSLQGMASGVDMALRQILGEDQLHHLREEGLYRRDVY